MKGMAVITSREKIIIETYSGVVHPDQLAHMGHMNLMWYTSKFDQGTWHYFAMLGITPSYIKEHNRDMAALEITTKYFSEAVVADLLILTTRMLEINNKTLKFKHVMSDAEVASSEFMGAHLDRQKRIRAPFQATYARDAKPCLPSSDQVRFIIKRQF